VHRAGRERPRLVERADRLLEVVAHHHAPERLDRMAGPPADDVACLAFLMEDVPDRLGGP